MAKAPARETAEAIRHATIEAGALKAALASVAGAVERRNTVPILANVALMFDSGGRIDVITTNLDMQVSRSVPCDSAVSWSTTVSAHLLKAMADKMPAGGEVSIDHGGARLVIRCGRARFELATLPIEDFPIMAAEPEWPVSFEMTGSELAAMLHHVKPGISTEETRYYLNGIYLERHEAELFAVATDGHRLASARRAAPDGTQPMGEAMPAGVIIPRQVLPVLEPMLKEARVTVHLSATRMVVESGEVTLSTKLVDGNFPDWRRVVPVGNEHVIRFDPAPLADAVERVATISADKTRALKIEASGDRLLLTVTSAEHGTATEEVPCDYGGKGILFGVNAAYLLGFLARLPGDTGRIEVRDAQGPVLIRSSEDAADQCVLMPLRV